MSLCIFRNREQLLLTNASGDRVLGHGRILKIYTAYRCFEACSDENIVGSGEFNFLGAIYLLIVIKKTCTRNKQQCLDCHRVVNEVMIDRHGHPLGPSLVVCAASLHREFAALQNGLNLFCGIF